MRHRAKKKIRAPGKTTVRFPLIMTLTVIVLIFLPTLLYILKSPNTLSFIIYDKTVPDGSANHHLALAWFLRNEKVLTPEGEIFKATSTYKGYFPLESEQNRIQNLAPINIHPDVLYIADTYGIYRSEGGLSRTQTEGNTSNLIYGGTTQEDVDALQAYLNRDEGNTLIAEYNTFATPTPSYVQAQLHEMFQTRWTGWSGQYVQDLSIQGETPPWIISQYETETNQSWPYTGSGIVLFNANDEYLILTSENDIGGQTNTFSFTQEGKNLLGLDKTETYLHLFDIVEPLQGAQVLASYTLDVTAEGLKKLHSHGLEPSFPAIVLGETANHKTYYFAGNWAYNPTPLRFATMEGVAAVMKHLSNEEQAFYWKTYIPLMQAILEEAAERKASPIPPAQSVFTREGTTKLVARTNDNLLQVWNERGWQDLFIHGVNLGIAMPGKWFTEFPNNKSVYYRWLTQIGELGVNTLRIYTLLDPQFYHAFSLYNRIHPDQPLYLMQEIWPEEEPEGNDYLDESYQREFEHEIRYVVDAIHGKAEIEERKGRAWGTYTHDVSSYVLGYLVGRELEPHEVEETDAINAGYTFSGSYLTVTPQATPTESWLAQSIDYLMEYEESVYSWQHPVAIVNWPTLDILEHDSERNEHGEKIKEYNDRTSVDINQLLEGPAMKAGLFGAYHIYPNYPDFMNNEPLYGTYQDEWGVFRYGGYLKEFMEVHTSYPAVVAEFGIATGMGNAHYNPDGYHHGGKTETEQAEGIIRMFEAMEKEGYAGGIIFEWMDEWAKKTWTTEPYMIPYDRQILWHNAIDPEQNYGLLAYEAVKPKKPGVQIEKENLIQTLSLRMDASFLSFDMVFSKQLDLTKEHLLIGLDTYGRDRGELLYAPSITEQAPSGMEFLVVLDDLENARLLAIPPYNSTNYGFASYPNTRSTAVFEPIRKLINKERALSDKTPIAPHFEESSILRYGDLLGSTNHWNLKDNTLSLRIPWTRIHVSDPSSGTVLDDPQLFYSDPLRDVLTTSSSEGIVVSVLVVENQTNQVLDSIFPPPLVWETWNQPIFKERLKSSYGLLQEYFSEKRMQP